MTTKPTVNESTAEKIDHLQAYDSINNIDAFNLPKLNFQALNELLNINIKTKNLKELLLKGKYSNKGGNFF